MNINRKHKIEALLEAMRPIKRHMEFTSSRTDKAHVTPAQWGVLIFVKDKGECSIKDIANELKITSSATTQLVNGLVASGYLCRQPSDVDRRAVSLSLSKEIKAQMGTLREAALQKMFHLCDVLSDRELEQLIVLHQKIAGAFNN